MSQPEKKIRRKRKAKRTRPKNRVQFSVYTPIYVDEQLKTLARRSKRSKAQVVLMLLRDALRREPEKIVGV